MTDPIRVLVVDDDFHVGGLHRDLVHARPGFVALDPVREVRAARAVVRDLRPDLVISDIYLPDGDGIAFIAEIDIDAMIISAASDGETIRRALRAGALDYLIKPFEPALLGARLDAYRRFRNVLPEDRGKFDQDTIERALRMLHHRDSATITASRTTTERLILDQVTDGEASATDIAESAGVSRATAQRYLAALASRGIVEVSLRYGATGRPEHRYRARP
jgi:response regulator of citrate/malate metabolism